MKNYYRVMLGRKSVFAEECFSGNFIGAGFIRQHELSGDLPDEWREFNKKYIPIWLKEHPGKSRIAAGLSCGFLWTIAKGIRKGDTVLCPDGAGSYRVGEVMGDYSYVPASNLPHQRAVQWFTHAIDRSTMSEALRNSTGAIGTISDISRYRDELGKLIGGDGAPALVASDPNVEDPAAFAMEKHLEDFLVKNWTQTELGKKYDIFEEEGEKVGQQYQTDTGPVDILAVSKDRKELLVVELKKGRASDVVVGQTLRYMGYVLDELAEKDQGVKGAIIALEDDQRMQRALIASPNISFYRYQISFKLLKA
jgi:restriction system protein